MGYFVSSPNWDQSMLRKLMNMAQNKESQVAFTKCLIQVTLSLSLSLSCSSQKGKPSHTQFNGHFRNQNWRYLPHIKGYVREYPHKIWPYMVQYLHFRVLKFPLIYSSLFSFHMHHCGWCRMHLRFDLQRRFNVLDSESDWGDNSERLELLAEMKRTLKQGSVSYQNPFGGDDTEAWHAIDLIWSGWWCQLDFPCYWWPGGFKFLCHFPFYLVNFPPIDIHWLFSGWPEPPATDFMFFVWLQFRGAQWPWVVDLVTSCQEYFLDSFCELLKHEQKAFFKIAQSCTTQGGTADSPAFFLAKAAKGCSVGMQAAVCFPT